MLSCCSGVEMEVSPYSSGLPWFVGVSTSSVWVCNVVMLYKCLGKISDNLHPNNKNNQLERRVQPSRDVP